eukprot:s292_g3.t1
MKRGFKGRRKGKGKGGKGSSGKRFFKRKKGKSNLADDNPDAWQTTDGQWQDSQWQDQYWDDWSWYESEESYASQFTFANSESTKCQQKLVIYMYDREYAVQSTEFDIVEQGHVPVRAPWNVRFDKHKKSSFLTYFSHYEYGFHQKTLGSSSLEEEPGVFAFAMDDEWVIDEASMELIRLHKKTRRTRYEPKEGEVPIPLEYLDNKRKTIIEFSKGKSALLMKRYAVTLRDAPHRRRHSSELVTGFLNKRVQGFLFEDIFEDFDDGTLCALCLRSERNSEALPVLPSSEEYSMLSENSRGKLPKPLQFVAPQRFVTSSLVQALSYIDNLLPGMEVEIHTTTSAEAVTLRPMIKNVRVLTLPYLEFEFCNVYRGTQGKTFPLIHRHPDAVVLLWCKGDYDHVFFVTVAQLLPCLQDMNLADWSMVVFWNESTGSGSKKGPDVGLDFTDQPAPFWNESTGSGSKKGPDVGLDFTDQPAPSPHVPQQPPVTPGEDLDYPGYDDPHVDMPVDDEDMPPPNSAPEPDLDDDPIELGSGGNPPPRPPGGGTHVPVPGGDGDEDLDMPHDPDTDGGHPPGGGPQGPGPGYGPSPDEPALPLLLEVLRMLLGLHRNMQIRTMFLVRLCRGRHHLHRLSLFLILLILTSRFLTV